MITRKNANDFESSFQDSCIRMHFEGIGELVDGISSMITRKSANDFESSFRALG